MPASTVEVMCPRCVRLRRVLRGSRAARHQALVAQDALPATKAWALICITCNLLKSRDKHEGAIGVLNRKIEERRRRGL